MTMVKGHILVLSNKREPEEGSFLGLEGAPLLGIAAPYGLRPC